MSSEGHLNAVKARIDDATIGNDPIHKIRRRNVERGVDGPGFLRRQPDVHQRPICRKP